MNLSSRIFIDGGDPVETKAADELLKKVGHHGLDGQTTNPTLIAKNFSTKHAGTKVTMQEAFGEYKRVVTEMAKVTQGPISIQVIGDPATLTAEEMLTQARDRITWIPNGIIKFPATTEGLKATEIFCQEGPVNITLNFSQEQAAAVYIATKAHHPEKEVFVSPFVGRFDDRGEKGMDVVANILQMYRSFGDGHVKVLTASIRNVKHILYALWLKSDIMTIPFSVFKQWADPSKDSGQVPFAQPSKDFLYDAPGLVEIPYREINLDRDWKDYDLRHDLTTVGLQRFWDDWKSIVAL